MTVARDALSYRVHRNAEMARSAIGAVAPMAAAVAESMFGQHGDENADIDVWCGSTWKRNLGRITYYQKVDSGLTSVRRFNQDVADDVVLGKVDVLFQGRPHLMGEMMLHISQE